MGLFDRFRRSTRGGPAGVRASLDEVRAALLAAKAEAEPEITPHHPQPGRSSTTRPWGDVIARTFKLKG